MKKLLVTCALGAVACSATATTPGPQAGTVNTKSAVSTTQGTIGAVVQVAAPSSGAQPEGLASAQALQLAAQAAGNIITPGALTTSAFPTVGDLRPLTLRPADTGTTGTCDCTSTGCTFKACSTGAVTMDGAYSWGGGHVVCQGLTYAVQTAGIGVAGQETITLECDMAVTATTLSGTFHSKGTSGGTLAGYTSTTAWDTTLTYASVTFASGSSSPTAGSAHVEGTYSLTITESNKSNGTPQTWKGSTDVSFPSPQ
jgi:hypothetical protein